MSNAVHVACCGNFSSGSLQDLLERALRRSHWRGPGTHTGSAHDPEEKLTVIMHVDVSKGRIVRIDYRATTCATLLAYCELLVNLVCGMSLDRVRRLKDTDLVERVRGVPPHRRARAALPIAALGAALASD